MNENMKRCAFHVLQIEPNFGNDFACERRRRLKAIEEGERRRARRRLPPYFMPRSRVVFVESEMVHERTHRKSENSDTGNENDDLKDCETFVSSLGLFKSKSLENINTSSHNFNYTYDLELESGKNNAETSDVELVSSKMKCLNV